MGNFPALSFDQANPVLAGISRAANIRNVNARTSDVENRNTPEMLRNKLMAMQLANRINEVKANYAEPQSQQDLIASQLANQINQVNAKYAEPKAQSGLQTDAVRRALIGAQTNLTGQRAKYLPLDKLIEAQKTMGQNQRFGPNYQLTKALAAGGPAYASNWIGQNEKPYNDMLTNIANATSDKQNSLITPDTLKQFFPGMIQNQAPAQGAQAAPAQEAQPAPMQGVQSTPQQQEITPPKNAEEAKQIASQFPETKAIEKIDSGEFKTQSPEQAQQMKNVLELNGNKKLVGSAMWTRAESAIALHKLLNDNQSVYAPRLANAAKYAGAFGKGQKAVDALKAETPQAYQDYLWFKNEFIPHNANQIKQMEKMGATDSQREELKSLFDRATEKMDVDPASALKFMNRAIKMMGDVGQSVIDTAEPINKGVINRAYNLKPIPENYISEDGGMAKALAPDGKTVLTGTRAQIDALIKDHPNHKRIS